jgi:hypothetical protein
MLLSAKYISQMNSREMAVALGRRGGRMRAKRLSAARKREIASLGGASRAKSLQAARRVADNFRYVTAIDALRRSSSGAIGVKAVKGRLPGLYPDRS